MLSQYTQNLDTQKIQSNIVDSARKIIKTIHIVDDIVDQETVIDSFSKLLCNNHKLLVINDDEIKTQLQAIATKELIHTYLALHKMSSLDDESYSHNISVTDRILDIAISIKPKYTRQEAEEMAIKLINDLDIYTIDLNKDYSIAKKIIHEMIYGKSIAKQVVQANNDQKHWAHIPVAKVISPNGTPINSPGTSPETNGLSEVLVTQNSKFSYKYPAIPGDSPFVTPVTTPENSPKKQNNPKQQSPILDAACKNALQF